MSGDQILKNPPDAPDENSVTPTIAAPQEERPMPPPPASSTNGRPKQPPRPSFLEKILFKLLPCVAPSERAHPVEPLDTLPTEKAAQQAPDPIQAPSSHPAPPAPEAISEPKPEEPPAVVPVEELMAPPTPVSLLSPAETEGVTSGAVQPPGSTGESVLHHPAKRDSAIPANDGDESDTSFTDDEDMDDVNLDDAQEEEDRLILNGGAGIPIGPVSIRFSPSPPLH